MNLHQKAAEVLFAAHDDVQAHGLARGSGIVGEAHCTVSALSAASFELYPDDFDRPHYEALSCLEEVLGHQRIIGWSDSSPVEVVLDKLQEAGKLALRKADET